MSVREIVSFYLRKAELGSIETKRAPFLEHAELDSIVAVEKLQTEELEEEVETGKSSHENESSPP